MIPELPEEVSDSVRLGFYDTLAGQYSDQSTLHMHWHTHKGNPAACWICDTNLLVVKLLGLCEKYITKSTLDMVTELSSEDDSDSEIETDLNYDDESPVNGQSDLEDSN